MGACSFHLAKAGESTVPALAATTNPGQLQSCRFLDSVRELRLQGNHLTWNRRKGRHLRGKVGRKHVSTWHREREHFSEEFS